ncbi:MAG TPA: hypothetical protein VFO95_17655 [Gemmatimonadales bacterium]|jgi:hypothetical protein|nr:hypothetical protein [Gemmatimonadales bacterium]
MAIEDDQLRGLAFWAADCAERSLHVFEEARPDDRRPRKAIELARAWARGDIPVSAARGGSSGANAAARETEEDSAARDAARAAGHAAASSHNPGHVLHAATYAVKALTGADIEAADKERAWQFHHLPEELRPLIYPPEEEARETAE